MKRTALKNGGMVVVEKDDGSFELETERRETIFEGSNDQEYTYVTTTRPISEETAMGLLKDAR